MQNGCVEYARVVRVLAREPEAIWQVIADFGGIARWIDGVSACEVSGTGVGAIRTVAIKDRQVRERLRMSDHARRVFAYEILPPHSLPASFIVSTIELSAAGPGSTRIVWRSEAVLNVDAEILRAAIEPFFAASLINLQRLLDAAA
jgi:hypothetical protein